MKEKSYRRAAGSAALCCLVAACGLSRMREESFADRCAHVMKEAFPGGSDIDVTSADSAIDKSAASITAMVARVEGVRKDVPEGGFVLREVAVECRFENGVLTGFRWTKGPLR